MKPQKPQGKTVRMTDGKTRKSTTQIPKSRRPSPAQSNAAGKGGRRKRKPPARMPLTPEAQRLRQKQIRGKMRRRRQRRRILMLVSAFALIVSGIVFCCKLLFQVNGVRIEIGEEKFHYVLPQAEGQESSQNGDSSAEPQEEAPEGGGESQPPAESQEGAPEGGGESQPPAEPQEGAPEGGGESQPPAESQEGAPEGGGESQPPAEPREGAPEGGGESQPPAEPQEGAPEGGEEPQPDSAGEGAEEPANTAQSTEQPAQTASPEVFRQGAKEVPLEQPIAQTGYTVGDIVGLLNVQAGENLLNIDLKELTKKVEQQYPYLENVSITYKLPNTIMVKAEIGEPYYYTETEQGYALLSKNQKVLEIAEQPPEGKISLKLGKVTTEAGNPLRFEPDVPPIDEAAILGQTNLSEEERIKKLQKVKEQEQEKAQKTAQERQEDLNTLLQLFDKWELMKEITEINVSDAMELTFSYQYRIVVQLGTDNQLDYKIQFAQEILTKQLSASDKGRLDVSFIREDGELRPVFSRDILN